MAEITFNKDEIVQFLVDRLEIGEIRESIRGLKGIDWNPFDDDGDEYVTVWEELRHNWDLISDVAEQLVRSVEFLVVDGQSLSSEQKHDAVVAALDKAIRVPWYVEPFDGLLIGLLVNVIVRQFNKINWGVGDGETVALIEVETTAEGFKEIG